jgi:hypothetical protein
MTVTATLRSPLRLAILVLFALALLAIPAPQALAGVPVVDIRPVDPTVSGTTVMRGGAPEPMHVTLNSNPGETTVVNLLPRDPSQLSVTPSTIVFGTNDWMLPRTVAVSAPESASSASDATIDAVVGSTVAGSATVSIADVRRAFVVRESTSSMLAIPGLRSSLYTVALGSRPSGKVKIRIAAGSTLFTSKRVLTFTRSNWNVPQAVLVSARWEGTSGLHRVRHAVISGDRTFASRRPRSVVVEVSGASR